MTRNDDLRSMEDFDAALRRWGGRPPGTPPAAARDAIAARLRAQRQRPAWRRLAAAALAAVLGALALLWWARGGSRPVNGVVAQLPPLEENVMVFYLDPDTPVYFVLPSTDRAGGV